MPSPFVVSLFAGAGGLSRGFADAGLRPGLAAEIDGDAVATYRANVSQAVIQADIGADVERVVDEVVARKGEGGVFAVIGGPPCQGFSTAGARDHGDERNRLVFSYLDIVERLKPAWFLFENVEGILTSGGGNAIVGLAERFTLLGYSFRVEKINFAGWGVPQARKRVLIVGNRHGVSFELPEATHAYDGKKHRSVSGHGGHTVTLGEAIAGLPATPAATHRMTVPYATAIPVTDYDARMRVSPPGPKAHAVVNFARDAERIRLLRPGQSLGDLPEYLWPDSYRSRAFRRVADGMPTERRGGAPAGIRRLDPEHASLTITGFSPRELVHPDVDRPLTLRECARLQGFPDGHDFHGSFQAVAQQIGNAVPPIAARTLARWVLAIEGGAGGDAGGTGRTVPPGLVGYHLTAASGMSPALAVTDARLRAISHQNRKPMMLPTKRHKGGNGQQGLFNEPVPSLSNEDREAITDSRPLGPGLRPMSDRELARTICVILRDLGHDDLIPEWARDIPPGSYYDAPLAWFTRDDSRPLDLPRFYLACSDRITNFRTIFRCMTKLHSRRRKFALILANQPIPTMDQIARRGLLEYGGIPVAALSSWLMWRKWVYDIDNRSAQDMALMFEPLMAQSLGGKSYSHYHSPVRRDGTGTGRQVDCIVDIGEGQRFAYEFKDRVTIAAAGKGRLGEEMSFPRDARASGYTPILMVMDPTPNPKLTALTAAFENEGGRAYLGDEAWQHLNDLSGPEVATFVARYIREPIARIAERERELLDLGMRYRTGPEGDSIEVTVGTHTWVIPRPRRYETVAVEGGSDGDGEE